MIMHLPCFVVAPHRQLPGRGDGHGRLDIEHAARGESRRGGRQKLGPMILRERRVEKDDVVGAGVLREKCMRIGAVLLASAWLSVLTAIKSTPCNPCLII